VTIDYSPFLEVDEEGCIWWPLEEALKLVAGYLPIRQNDRKGTLVLDAPDHEVAFDPELIWYELSDPTHLAGPRVFEDSYGYVVEARNFISWFIEYAVHQSKKAEAPAL
jgi:hypothetical protein